MNKSYTLTGPEQISLAELTRRIADELGRDIAFRLLPMTAEAEQAVAQSDTFHHQHIAAMTKALQMGIGALTTPDFVEVTGRPPRSVEQFLRENRQLFGV